MPHLRSLLHDAGVDEPIRQIRVETDADAQAQRFLGSPTLRIDGVDVDPTTAQRTDYALQCRLYPTDEGLQRIPPDEWILAALQRRQPPAP